MAEFVRQNADLEDRFIVVGADQREAASVDEVRRIVEARAAGSKFKTELLPVLLVHKGESGTYQRFSPEGLGDMVLLDSHGVVIAGGAEALSTLNSALIRIRQRISYHVDALAAAKTPAEVESHLPELYLEGTSSAEAAAENYVETCPPALAKPAFSVMARAGRYDVVLRGLQQKDSKRRKAALEALASNPSAEVAGPVLDVSVRKDVGDEEARLALIAAFAAAPAHPDLVARVSDYAKRTDIPGRAWCMEFIGRIRTTAGKERLLLALMQDPGRIVRIAAAAALVAFGGPDVRAALERLAAADKIDTVRAAAKKALDDLDKQSPPAAK